MKKLTSLKPEWERQIPEWNRKWIEFGLSTEPADFEAFERGAKACYEFAGVPWPGVVIRVPSPIVGALAAPIAATFIELLRGKDPRSAADSAVDSAADSAADSTLSSHGARCFLRGSIYMATFAFSSTIFVHSCVCT